VRITQYDFGYNDDDAEIDISVAYCFILNDSFWLDTSITNYHYTDESDSSVEWKLGIGHEPFKFNHHHD
jgi:hypothetical protein